MSGSANSKSLEGFRPAVLPPGVAQPNPSADLIQSPSSAPIIDTARSMTNEEDYGLYSCYSSGNAITCYLVVSRTAAGQRDYNTQQMPLQQTKLIDNLHVEHRLRRAFFIDGLGGRQQSTNLSTGESMWLALEFEQGPAHGISSVRIVFSSYGTNQLRGPVVSGP